MGPQWVGVIVAILGFLWTGMKDYSNGNIKLPNMAIQSNAFIQKQEHRYPIQYCLMAYDPNIDKVWYRHEDGSWKEYAPEQRKYGTVYR